VDVDHVSGGTGFEWDFVSKFSLQDEVDIDKGRQHSLLPDSNAEPRMQFGHEDEAVIALRKNAKSDLDVGP
jgi:hypothetical protein